MAASKNARKTNKDFKSKHQQTKCKKHANVTNVGQIRNNNPISKHTGIGNTFLGAWASVTSDLRSWFPNIGSITLYVNYIHSDCKYDKSSVANIEKYEMCRTYVDET